MSTIRVEKVVKRYWWPHPMYRSARREGWNCFKPGKLYIDWVVDFRYFVDGVETNLFGQPIKPGTRL